MLEPRFGCDGGGSSVFVEGAVLDRTLFPMRSFSTLDSNILIKLFFKSSSSRSSSSSALSIRFSSSKLDIVDSRQVLLSEFLFYCQPPHFGSYSFYFSLWKRYWLISNIECQASVSSQLIGSYSLLAAKLRCCVVSVCFWRLLLSLLLQLAMQ